MLGNFKDFVLAEGDYVPSIPVVYIAFLISVLILLIIMLNLLIAIISDVYNRVIAA